MATNQAGTKLAEREPDSPTGVALGIVLDLVIKYSVLIVAYTYALGVISFTDYVSDRGAGIGGAVPFNSPEIFVSGVMVLSAPAFGVMWLLPLHFASQFAIPKSSQPASEQSRKFLSIGKIVLSTLAAGAFAFVSLHVDSHASAFIERFVIATVASYPTTLIATLLLFPAARKLSTTKDVLPIEIGR